MTTEDGEVFDAFLHGAYFAGFVGICMGIATWNLETGLLGFAVAFAVFGIAPGLMAMGARDEAKRRTRREAEIEAANKNIPPN